MHHPQQRPEPAALFGVELGAVAMATLDPGVEGVGVAADDRDGAAVVGREGRGDRDAERGQALGGAVLAGDRLGGGRLEVEVVLEEIAAAGRAESVAAVEKALVDGIAGEGGSGGVLAEEGTQRGRVRHEGWYRRARHAPDARARASAVSWALSRAVTERHSKSLPVSFGHRTSSHTRQVGRGCSSGDLGRRDNVPLLRPPARL